MGLGTAEYPRLSMYSYFISASDAEGAMHRALETHRRNDGDHKLMVVSLEVVFAPDAEV